MKKITSILGLSALLLSSLASAHAALAAYDGFDGSTVINGGTGWSGNWSPGINAGDNLNYGGLVTTGAGANVGQWWAGESERSLSTAITSGIIWLSWVQTVGPTPTDFTQIRIQNGGSRAFTVGQHNDAKTFKIYDGNFNVGANTGISITGTHFVAMSVDLATNLVNLYINPTGLGSGAAPSSSVSATWDGPDSISGITGLRSVGPNSNNLTWDEVRIGTTWASVSPSTAGAIPAAPSALQATVNSFSEITLNWMDNSSDELSFTVERSLDGLTGWTSAGTAGIDITTFQDTGLSASTTYYHRVTANNSNGSSAFTTVLSLTTSPLPPPPAAPSALQATVNSFSEITLTWTDNSTNELSYTVERTSDGITWMAIGTTAADIVTLQDTGLSAATQYSYRVFTTGFGGNSTNSALVSPTTSALPALVALDTIYVPFADLDGDNASLAELVTGVTAFVAPDAWLIQTSSALSYPGVPSFGNGLTTGQGRFFMTLDTTLPGLARYMSGGRIGGSGLGVLYVSWMARGINGGEANTVEFRAGNADNQSIVAVGTTFGNEPNIRLITGNTLTSGAQTFITTSHPASPATDFFVVKFTFWLGNTATVELFINQTTEGTPVASSTCFAQFNTIGLLNSAPRPTPLLMNSVSEHLGPPLVDQHKHLSKLGLVASVCPPMAPARVPIAQIPMAMASATCWITPSKVTPRLVTLPFCPAQVRSLSRA